VEQVIVFPPDHVGQVRRLGVAGALFALVARDEAPPVRKGVDGEAAPVGTALAGSGHRLVGEVLQRLPGDERALWGAVLHGAQRRAVGAHQLRDGKAHHVASQLLFKAAQHRVVEEGAALHHDVLSQLVGAAGADDLVNGVFDDADGQPGGVYNCCNRCRDGKAILF